jgi:hypothetical protein
MSRNWPKTIKRISRRYTSWYWNAGKVFHYFDSKKLPNLTVLEDEDLINYLVVHNKSFIRWGDGESAIIYGSDLMFQDYNPNLKKDMICFLKDHVHNEKFILGISHHFISMSLNDFKNQPGNRPNIWRTTRYIIHKFCSLQSTYGDAFLFRPLSNVSNSDLQKLWQDKHVILLSSDKDHLNKLNNRNNAASVHQILIPSNNCYEVINGLENKILNLVEEISQKKESIRIMISGGPGGKVLAHRLILKDFIVYDVGNYFTWKIDNKTNKKGI